MTGEHPPLDVRPMWSQLNDELIELVDLFGDEHMNWSPKPARWNARGILLHVIFGRFGITGVVIQDGKENPSMSEGRTTDGLKSLMRSSWERMTEFAGSDRLLAGEYLVPYQGNTAKLSGHWLAFGLLEHDIHHRGELLGLLDELGVAHTEPDSVERRLRQMLR